MFTKRNINIVLFVLLSVLFICPGCKEELFERNDPSEYIVFTAELSNMYGARPVSRASSNSIDIEVNEWPVLVQPQSHATKASLNDQLNDYNNNGGAKVYIFTSATSTNSVYTFWKALDYTFDGDQMFSQTPQRWSLLPDATQSLQVFVAAPNDVVSNMMPADIARIDVSNILLSQSDIVVAEATVSESAFGTSIPLAFKHILTAIQFKAGFDCTIKSISLSNICLSGSYASQQWTSTNSQNINFQNLNIEAKEGEFITFPSLGNTLLMIPQTMSDAQLQITYTKDGINDITATASLNSWGEGRQITYTLYEASEQYIYFDLALGNITINSTTYSGSIYGKKDDGSMGIKSVSGTHQSGNRYYVYQSLPLKDDEIEEKIALGDKYKNYNKNNGYTHTGWDATGNTLTRPTYPEVQGPNGEPWRDYITITPGEDVTVENVIEAWDDMENVKAIKGESYNSSEPSGTAAKVIDAGRQACNYNIDVSGSVGNCELVIDNIYSVKQNLGANRTYGSIGFKPTAGSGSTLTIKTVGDNRVGCVHFDNTGNPATGKNFLVFEGSGTLTVADADFYVYTDYGNKGYYSNHFDAAIGNSDGKNDCYGIIINSGTIFAGTTLAENCSAIGGGGNGYGEVTINGGVVTAMATTTGTAIGGGIGFSSYGGVGLVNIHGGNVYAYNHKNKYSSVPNGIPSSAIGGAGTNASYVKPGTKVNITGGSVYAQSGFGTAIGGGSSNNSTGGEATINISGGTVIAKALDPNSAGIGGGNSYTGKSSGSGVGGDAIITISGNPIIRTGSIGGGTSNQGNGSIGKAVINISGDCDIQAQFVMAASTAGTPEFTMSGGTIRNTNTADQEYYCIKPHGGAVYMERGTFIMSGGTIKNCKASKSSDSKGGAVYIEGDVNTSFSMSGGTIENCSSNGDGGAIYLAGGKVTLSGGEIRDNVSQAGNGGAVAIVGGNFYLGKDGVGTAQIKNNAAFASNNTQGRGGGIYVAPASATSTTDVIVDLLYGSILANASDYYGGGVCVDMGSNTTANVAVTVGAKPQAPAVASKENPLIEGNTTTLKGGGLYVYGSKASVVMNDGQVLGNTTSGYQANQDVSLEGGGLVTLNAEGLTTQVTVTFNNNAQYYIDQTDATQESYVVSSNKTLLPGKPAEWTQLEGGYYTRFEGWNTKRDGSGESYADGATILFDEDITLYAQWSHTN